MLHNNVTTHKQVPKVPSWFTKSPAYPGAFLSTGCSYQGTCSYLRPDGEVEEAVPAVEVERAVEVDDGLVGVLALQRELARLVARQDGVGDFGVYRVGFVRVVRGDPAEDRQTCNCK